MNEDEGGGHQCRLGFRAGGDVTGRDVLAFVTAEAWFLRPSAITSVWEDVGRWDYVDIIPKRRRPQQGRITGNEARTDRRLLKMDGDVSMLGALPIRPGSSMDEGKGDEDPVGSTGS